MSSSFTRNLDGMDFGDPATGKNAQSLQYPSPSWPEKSDVRYPLESSCWNLLHTSNLLAQEPFTHHKMLQFAVHEDGFGPRGVYGDGCGV